jgi:hypothetical protein
MRVAELAGQPISSDDSTGPIVLVIDHVGSLQTCSDSLLVLFASQAGLHTWRRGM